MALYEISYLNFVTAGPATIVELNRKARYISMNILCEGSQEASRKTYRKIGLEIGKNFNFANWHQILSWKEDNFDNIAKEFQEFRHLEKKNESDV